VDQSALQTLKNIETQVEYLRSIENLLERVVKATEATNQNMEALRRALEQSAANANAANQQNPLG
jgi:hypothetical protein